MEKELPKNWVDVSLQDVTRNIKGKKPKIQSELEFEGSIPYMDIKALEFNEIRQFADIESSKLFEEGDVAMVWDGARSGWVSKTNFGAIGSTLVAFKPIKINSNYLFYYLLEKYPYINSNARGVGIPHVDPTVLWSLKFPLPPLSEQNRIVEKLDRLFGQLEVINSSMEKIPVLLKNFREQVLTQAVTGKLTEKWIEGKELENWRETKLSIIADIIDPHPSHRTPSEVHNGIPYIGIGDIDKNGDIDFTNARKVSENILNEHLNRYTLRDGDFIFGKIGTIGRPIIIPSIQNYTLSANVILIKPRLDVVNSKFLFYYLDSPVLLQLIKADTKSTSQPAYGIKKMREQIVPLPSTKEQQEIVSRVESLFAKADAIEEKYKNLKAKIETLPQTILHKAFKGELSEQLETDGDARDLLEEILALKNGKKPKKNVAKKYVKPDEILRIVAEESLSYPTLSTRDKKVQRKMLATHIINQSLEDKSFGKTKFEKLLHLIECHVLQRDLNQNYSVQAAGPYDGGFTKTFWDEVLKSKWFAFEQQGTLKRIVSGENQNKSVKEYGYFSNEEKQKINDFIAIFENTNYERPEIVSTLYAVWNNRIKRNEAITDHLLKEDFLNWDPGKAKYKDRLDKALEWMRENGIVPNGWGNEIKRSKRK